MKRHGINSIPCPPLQFPSDLFRVFAILEYARRRWCSSLRYSTEGNAMFTTIEGLECRWMLSSTIPINTPPSQSVGQSQAINVGSATSRQTLDDSVPAQAI